MYIASGVSNNITGKMHLRRLQKVLQAMLSSLQKIRKYKLATIILNGHFQCELKTYMDSLIRSINGNLFTSWLKEDLKSTLYALFGNVNHFKSLNSLSCI